MKFFIDTANLDQIAEAQAMGILDGVTTNPSLMAKEGITGKDNILAHYRKICRLVPGGAISAEVLSTDYASMIAEGHRTGSPKSSDSGKSTYNRRRYASHKDFCR